MIEKLSAVVGSETRKRAQQTIATRPRSARRPFRAGEPDLKPLDEQVIVITGASSGIGLATARMAAERGARLVLAARSDDALAELTEEIRTGGSDAVSVTADVSDREDVREIAATAVDEFGGFDTWINVAGVFLYGRLVETPVEDMREQFETNVWGLLYGSLEAAEHLRDRGGAIINIGSVASERALPLQGSYSASKHAVKGFTDALRMELEEAGAPVSVTLVEPSAIDTPYPRHAKNYMDEAATLPPPVYAPETVARAVLDAAERPRREVTVGGGGKWMTVIGNLAPRLVDKLMEATYFGQQRKDRPPRPIEENSLDGPAGALEERGDRDGHVADTSLYTGATRHRRATRSLIAGVGLIGLVYAVFRRLSDEVRE